MDTVVKMSRYGYTNMQMDEPLFLTDIYLPQMLFALTIRSPIAKGRLISIECPELPANYTLIRAQDIPGKNCLDDSSLPILVDTEISYIGEPLALLLGPDKSMLEQYSRLCTINVEEGEIDTGSIAARRDICMGDPETAFAQAASVIHGCYSTGIQEHWYAEPSGAITWLEQPNGQGKLMVRTATQWPFHVKRSVAQVLGSPALSILVKPTITGLHMDGKLWYPSFLACHAALGTWITKRPVRLILTRKEDFFFATKRCGTEIDIVSALDEKGNITALEINTSVNLGAHAVNALEILDHVNLGSCGVYKTKNIRLSSVALQTNIPPQGCFAGFGLAQGFFALERHISQVADTLTLEPAQWRKDHCTQAGMLPLGLPVKDAPGGALLIDSVMKMSDYRRKWASYEALRQNRKLRLSQENRPGDWVERAEGLRGIGIAVGYQGNGLLHYGSDKGHYGIELVLAKDGILEIKTSMLSTDGGSVWMDIASEILGIKRDMIRISCSTQSPDAGPLVASRNITVITKLISQACLVIRKKRFRDPLPLCVRKTIRPQKNPVWDACFSPQENGKNESDGVDYNSFVQPGWASAIVELEIDPVEYLPRIRGVWLYVDGGAIIAEERARRSLKTAAVQALGWAYREQIHYIAGAIPADQYENFDIPGIQEIPPITIEFFPNTQSEPKGIGDLPFTCIPAAYAQAVSQAMDYQFQSIPIKPINIWHAGIKKLPEEGLV
ncbi:MAG: molybdopterin-dependent oxidoreductase [Treponema sp.]|nr:molybdopterin-dependent oxidoreductase [Treponema sp.]